MQNVQVKRIVFQPHEVCVLSHIWLFATRQAPLSKWSMKVTQSYLTLCDYMVYTVHGILQTEYWSG